MSRQLTDEQKERKRIYEREWRRRKYAEDPEYRARKKATDQRWADHCNKRITAYKLERGCAHCGYNTSARALQFHHTDDKEFEISTYRARSWERLLIEIEKCILLCANCHAEEHDPDA